MSNDHERLTPTQRDRLAAMLDAILGPNAFWTDRLGREGFTRESFTREPITTLAELRRLPLTSKADLVADAAAHPPYGSNLTNPLAEYVRFHQTSGTTGQPQVWLDTADSWDWFGDCWRAIYAAIGVTAADIIALPFSFGPFIGFWAAHDGATAFGCLSLTLGGLSTEQRLREIVRHNATVLCCTPIATAGQPQMGERREIIGAAIPHSAGVLQFDLGVVAIQNERIDS